MGRFGGNLKRMEKLTGRLADVFSQLYFATSILRRFEAEGRLKEDIPLATWALDYSFATIQNALDGLYQNIGFPFKGPIALLARLNPIAKMPSDKAGAKVAQIMQTPGAQRDRLTNNVFLPEDKEDALGRLENAFGLIFNSAAIMKKISKGVKSKVIQKGNAVDMVASALQANLISADEAKTMQEAEAARNDTIQVDDFSADEYLGKSI